MFGASKIEFLSPNIAWFNLGIFLAIGASVMFLDNFGLRAWQGLVGHFYHTSAHMPPCRLKII